MGLVGVLHEGEEVENEWAVMSMDWIGYNLKFKLGFLTGCVTS